MSTGRQGTRGWQLFQFICELAEGGINIGSLTEAEADTTTLMGKAFYGIVAGFAHAAPRVVSVDTDSSAVAPNHVPVAVPPLNADTETAAASVGALCAERTASPVTGQGLLACDRKSHDKILDVLL